MRKVTYEWQERAKNCLAQGSTGTNSKRPSQFIQGVYPTHTDGTGIGPYLFDVNGNKYMDFICGLGAVSLGYSNQRVVEATQRQCAKGASHSLPTTLEVEVAEMLCGLIPSVNRVRFLKNGDDAARAAIRIARAATGRSLILSDGYHGHSDIFTSMTPPSLGIKEDFHIMPLNMEEPYFDKELHVAAVIVEALKLEMSDEWAKKLRSLRDHCRKNGTLFIIDEIITGFRVPGWTVSNMWDLDPDIILVGKGMANGFPLSAVMGKREFMDSSEYFVSTTFSGEAVSLAACKATLIEMQQKSFEDLMYYGKKLQDRLNSLHSDIKFEGWGTRCMLNSTHPSTALFMQEMCKAGFLFGKAHFFNFAHLEESVETQVLGIAATVVDRMKRGEVELEGSMPQETFRR